MLILQKSKRIVKEESGHLSRETDNTDRTDWQFVDWEIDASLDGWRPGVYEPEDFPLGLSELEES